MTTHEQSIAVDLQAEIDQLRQENAELNKLASLKLTRSRIKELQADNARLNSEKAEVVRGFDLVQAQYQSTKKAIALQGEEIDRLRQENERLQAVVQCSAMVAAKAEGLARELQRDATVHLATDKQIHSENLQLSGLLGVGDIHGERVRAVEAIKSKSAVLEEQVANAIAFLASEKRRAKEKEKVCRDNGDTHGENFFAGQFSGYNEADIALQAINRYYLRDLLAPTIELIRSEAESANNIRRGRLISEVNRLRKLIPERGGDRVSL